MKRQRNTQHVKEQDKCPPNQTKETEIGNLPDKESACNVGDLSSIPGLGQSPGEGKGYPLQYSGLENSMDYIVHGAVHGDEELDTTE